MPTQTEQLAEALYNEWHKKLFPNAAVHPFTEVSKTSPNVREAWLAVADMAILNLTS